MIDSYTLKQDLKRIRQSQIQLQKQLNKGESYLHHYLSPTSKSDIHNQSNQKQSQQKNTINFHKTTGPMIRKKQISESSINIVPQNINNHTSQNRKHSQSDNQSQKKLEKLSPKNQCSFSLSNSNSVSLIQTNYHSLQNKKIPNLHKQILQANYLKIQQLLLKQRSLQQQSHLLQEQNDSLMNDYRSLKKSLYEQKQRVKYGQNMMDLLLNQIVYKVILSELVQKQTQLNRIRQKLLKRWRKQTTYSHQDKQDYFYQEGNRFIENITKLLQQKDHRNIKVSKIQQKQLQKIQQKQLSRIQQKQRQIQQLLNKLKRQQQKYHQNQNIYQNKLQQITNKAQNQKKILTLKIQRLQSQLILKQEQQAHAINKLQRDILNIQHKYKNALKQFHHNSQSTTHLTKTIQCLNQKNQLLQKQIKQTKQSFQTINKKYNQVNQLYHKQLELNRNQNTSIAMLNAQISRISQQLVNNKGSMSNTMNFMRQQENSLKMQINKLKHDNALQQQKHKQEVQNLNKHLIQLKNQYNTLLAIQNKFTSSQLKYKQLCALRQNTMKMSSQLDHLWNVKQIQYQNIMEVLHHQIPKIHKN